MGTIGKKVVGIVVGIALFILIQEVRSRFGSNSSSSKGEKITQQEVDLYLRVMRATAERVNSPHAEELGVLEAFNQIPNARTAQASQLSAEQKETILDAQRLTASFDFVVADELKVGAEEYESAKYALEDLLPPPEAPGDAADLTDAQRKVLDNRAEVLVPHVNEIRDLQRTFFNNPLRKTVYGE